MNTNSYQFRSRSEREREVDLSRNYGQIGNKAVAAASQSCCKAGKSTNDSRKAPVASRKEALSSH